MSEEGWAGGLRRAAAARCRAAASGRWYNQQSRSKARPTIKPQVQVTLFEAMCSVAGSARSSAQLQALEMRPTDEWLMQATWRSPMARSGGQGGKAVAWGGATMSEGLLKGASLVRAGDTAMLGWEHKVRGCEQSYTFVRPHPPPPTPQPTHMSACIRAVGHINVALLWLVAGVAGHDWACWSGRPHATARRHRQVGGVLPVHWVLSGHSRQRGTTPRKGQALLCWTSGSPAYWHAMPTQSLHRPHRRRPAPAPSPSRHALS